jgi:hypothetical protein
MSPGVWEQENPADCVVSSKIRALPVEKSASNRTEMSASDGHFTLTALIATGSVAGRLDVPAA